MSARLIHMKCQNCGANLELDLDKLIAFCPFCGAKLMIDVEQLSSVLVEKEKTKQIGMEYDHDLETKRMEIEERKRNQKEADRAVLFFIIGVAIFIALIQLGILHD